MLSLLPPALTIFHPSTTHIIMFNKEMAAKLNLESPYDLVRDGKWTFDKFAEFGAAAKNDLNGDGVMDLNDQYGFVSAPKQIPPSFWEAAGQLGIVKDSNDIPQFTMATDETFTNILLDIYKLTWDTGIWYVTTDAVNIPDSSTALFQENKALMMDSTFFYLNSFREMLSDFAILPYPKYTEEQENYRHVVATSYATGFTIPANLSGEALERSCVVLTALSANSQNAVNAYYEVNLKFKNARDVASADMLEIIFNSKCYELGKVFDWGRLETNVVQAVIRKPGTFASQYEANKTAAETQMQESYNRFK